MSFAAEYPYMASTLLLLALALLLQACAWRQWRVVLLGGLLLAPHALFSFEFIPEYWDPHLVAWWGITSPEDLLFSYGGGVAVCVLAFLPFGSRLSFNLNVRVLLPRYLILHALGIGTGYFVDWVYAPADTMTAALASITLCGILLIIMRRDLWPVMLSGAVLFTAYYALTGWLAALLWPHFLTQWTPSRHIALEVLGFPVSELVWALGVGLVWPLMIAYCCDARLKPLRTAKQEVTTRQRIAG